MDWFQVLVVVLLIVFPLLQQVLGRKDEPLPPPTRDPERGEPGEPSGAAGTDAPATILTEADGGWASGWGGWPEGEEEAEEAAEIASTGVVHTEEVAARLSELQGRLPAEHVPETVRVSAPVVSMESLYVDRAAEHRRFHARGTTAAAKVRRRGSRLADLLRDRDELRRAIIMAEVVGPPRGLR